MEKPTKKEIAEFNANKAKYATKKDVNDLEKKINKLFLLINEAKKLLIKKSKTL